MAGVFFDVPGIGKIEAQGAASEATMQAILKALGGGGRGAGGGGGGGGTVGRGSAGGGAGGGFDVLGTAGGALGKVFNMLGVVTGFTTGVMGKLASGAFKATAAAIGLGESITGAVQSLSQLDGSAQSAANIFKSIPLIGPIFSAVAAAADDVTRSYQAVAQSGASFGGSISKFAAASSEAGMSMAEFGSLIKNNSDAMTAFGTTTEGGAANFAKVSKQLRGTNSELYALGFSTTEINQGLASYGALMKSQGLQGKKSNTELAQGAKSYLKEMDLLAKVTGQSRSDIEKSREQMAKDAQFQASMSGLGEGVRNSFLSVTDGLKDTGLKNFAKDIMATGTATTEENQKLMAMMPQSAAMLQRMNQKMQRGEAVTLEERQALNNLMMAEGGKQLQSVKYAGAASSELGSMVNSLNATQSLNKDSLIKATEEQKKAAKETDQMNKKMSEFQAAIAEVSNSFKMLLANSGILDVLIQAFHGVVNLAKQYLVPAFNIVASVVMKVANGIGILLQPALDYLSEKFGSNGLAGTAKFLDDVLNAVFPIFAGAMRGAIIIFDSLYTGIQAVIKPFNELVSKLFGVSDSTTSFSDIIIDISGRIGLVIQYLSVGIQAAIIAFDGLLLGLQGVIEPFKELMNKIFGVSDSADGFTDILIDAGAIANKVFQYLGVVIESVIIVLDGLWNGISAIFQPLKELATNLLGLISSVFGASEGTTGFVDIVIGAGKFLAEIFQYIGKAIGVVIKVIDFALTPVFYVLAGGLYLVIGVFNMLWGGLKLVIDVFAKLMDIIQDVGTFFSGLMDMILFAVGKLTKGLAGISEDEYKARNTERDKLKADREKERKNRDDHSKQEGKAAEAAQKKTADNLKKGLAQTDENTKNQKAAARSQIVNYKASQAETLAAQKAAAKADAKRFGEKKVSHDQLTGAAQREAAAKEAAIKAQEKLLDYTAGPEALLKQFSDKEGGAVEIGIKKGEINKEKIEADKELAAAKTGAEKRAAAEKIEAAEAKLTALNEAEALAKQRTGTAPTSSAAAPADAAKKSIEADAEKKKAEEAAAKTKADEEAAAKTKAEEDANKKKEENKTPQESQSVLLAELNNKMATLLKYTFTVAHNTNETVTATRSLNKNGFK